MELSVPSQALIANMQHNCDISDARDHGIYSMCTMVLKLRNLYKWENDLQPWEEPDSPVLLDWIDAKEKYWATLEDQDYLPLPICGRTVDPLAIEEVNGRLEHSLFYGAGYGRSLKTVFFLAEKEDERVVEGCPVIILGKELVREMASPFAMSQDGRIIIRTEPLRTFFWDQIQELRSSCRSSLRFALDSYGLLSDGQLDQQRFREQLDTIVATEMHLFIAHEVGEILQGPATSESLRLLISHFPGSVMEFVGRAIKDILADTHPQGLIAAIIGRQRTSSLAFYLGFMDGLRARLFPELDSAWPMFLADRDWRHIEQARHSCYQKILLLAEKLAAIARMLDHEQHDTISARFTSDILIPLGLDAERN